MSYRHFAARSDAVPDQRIAPIDPISELAELVEVPYKVLPVWDLHCREQMWEVVEVAVVNRLALARKLRSSAEHHTRRSIPSHPYC